MSDRRSEWLATLGLSPGASAAQVRRAYRDLVQVWHPDRFEHDQALRDRAERQLTAINEAYARLAHGSDDEVFEIRRAPGPATSGRPAYPPADEARPAWTRDALAVAPYAVLALVALGVVWMVDSRSAPAEAHEPTRAAAAPRDDIADAPMAAIAAAEPAAPAADADICAEAASRPRSGTEFGGERRPGHGRLTVANVTTRDALAVLSDVAIDRPRRAVYVRAGEEADVGAIPPGSYHLRFQFGQVWLESGRFCQPDQTAEFDDVLTWDEEAQADGVRYSAITATLAASPDATTRGLTDTPLSLPRR